MYSEYKMFVKLVNGVRDGTAIIMTKEYEFIKLTYRNGEMTGEVEKMDRYLNVLLKGFLVNGEERGYSWSIITAHQFGEDTIDMGSDSRR